MLLYDFSLRFNFPEAYRINSDVEEIELLALPLGERSRMRSGAIRTPIRDRAQVAVLGGPFTSEGEARDAAEKSKRALLYWAIEQRVGIDFGGGKQRSGVTKAGLASLQKQLGRPVRKDVHGIDVYAHVERLVFVGGHAEGQVGKHPPKLINIFQREYLHTRRLTEKQILASEIYASSFFDVSPRSRFITLVTAVEALLERPKRPDLVEELVKEFKDKAHLLNIDKETKESITGSLRELLRESITQAGRKLAGDLIPNKLFIGQSSADFFAHCYGLRSQILHRGKIEDGLVDLLDLANVMEGFVAKLLLGEFESGPQQGTSADEDN
jgi:hypothetical protein